jgi:vacuolar-type H+-ATPase catalytic subunit A/Vma1
MIEAVNKINDLSYKDRLIEEYLVLESRMLLLHNFINSPRFDEFSCKYSFYMRMQYAAMKMYFKYLKKRLDYLSIDKKDIDIYISEENAKAKILKEHLNRIEKDLKEKKEKKVTPKKPKKDVKNKKD